MIFLSQFPSHGRVVGSIPTAPTICITDFSYSPSASVVLCEHSCLISLFPVRADYLQVAPTHIFYVVTRVTLVD